MNARQIRALERRNKVKRDKTLSPIITGLIFAGIILVVGYIGFNMLLGDNGKVCQSVSTQKSIELGCKQ